MAARSSRRRRGDLAHAAPEPRTQRPSAPVGGPTCTTSPPPPAATSIIGRDELIRRIVSLLEQPAALATLVGPGGVGKTRLAQAVASVVEPSLRDGIVWTPLATVHRPDEVAGAIGRALGLREQAEVDTLAAVLTALRHRELLLVLDNMEQVLDGAPTVAAIRAACPSVRVLVTSRAGLRLSGEQTIPVEPLSLPSADPTTDTPALTLFRERARRRA